jgi:hypothetical protein
MSGYVLRGLVTEDGELDYSQHWMYGFHEGEFLAALFDDVVDGEWWEGKWYPFHDPQEPIEAYAVETVEELDEILTGGEIPDVVIAELREERRQYISRQDAGEPEAER